ncbi:MAG: citrate lyase subunit alpha [Candidatus Hermodarchaeota archaeon]
MTVKNALGRSVPLKIFGKTYKPYQGAFTTPPKERRYGRKYHNYVTKFTTKKIYDSLEKVIEASSLKDGMTIGFHHCLRLGDEVINQVVQTIASMGIKNITLASTALFQNHEPLIEHILDGTITCIEGSMNGPIGNAVCTSELEIPTFLRSHGGRTRAVEAGDLHIDVSFIASSAVDQLGNLSGVIGPNAFGSMGFVKETDALYADVCIAVTDFVSEKPLVPVSIFGGLIDYIVTVDRIGDPKKITTGSLGRKARPEHMKIAEEVVDIVKNAGSLKEGFSFQAGAGGVSLAVTQYLEEVMQDLDIKGSFIHGGATESAVKLLEEGLFEVIYDGQTFDIVAARSLRDNPRHIESSASFSYNIYNPGGPLANYVDVVALGATEVDIDFNVNVNTFSNGMLMNGIGGHTDAAAAKITIITCPVARKVPTIIDKVTTVSTPGEMIDIVATDYGIAVNPRRPKLREKLEKAGLPVRGIKELRDEAYSLAEPVEVKSRDRITTVVEFRDGTILDVIYQVKD